MARDKRVGKQDREDVIGHLGWSWKPRGDVQNFIGAGVWMHEAMLGAVLAQRGFRASGAGGATRRAQWTMDKTWVSMGGQCGGDVCATVEEWRGGLSKADRGARGPRPHTCSAAADLRLTNRGERCLVLDHDHHSLCKPRMTSLVASKPSDGPTSPGLMSYGSDPSALDDYLNLDLFGSSRAAPQSPASSHGALPITPGTSAETQTDETMAFDAFNPLDKMAPFDMGLLGSDLGMDQYGSLFQDMFPSFSEPASGPSAPVIDPQLFAASPPSLPPPIPPPAPAVPASAPTPAPELPLAAAAIVTDDEDDEDEEIAPLPTRTRKPKKNAAAAGGISKRPSRASTPASVLPS